MPAKHTHAIDTIQAPEVTVRVGGASDAAALRRLAVTDSAEPLGGPALLAELDGKLVAAVALAGGRTIADPFVPTAAIVELLELRLAQIRSASNVSRLPRRFERTAPHAA
jgi:hypothetical protein